MLVATDAIVLRSRKQGDTSKIVTLYSKEYGLVDVIAKGARQQKSKFGSALEPFTNSKIVFYRKEQSELYLLSAAEVNLAHRRIMADLDHIEAATRIAELLIRSQHHEEGHAEIFDLVCRTLGLMDATTTGEAVWPILYWFFLRYSALSGFEITFTFEPQEGKHFFFDTEIGDIIELDGGGSSGHEYPQRYVPLTREIIGAVKYLNANPLEHAAALRLSPSARIGLDTLFRTYFGNHLEGMQRGRAKSERVFGAMKNGKQQH
ncbi:MAG: DNA repair protein RecO [Bacteroidetes bacterium]|nr:DNA repair protein RecO [Bacteroidota bacterium]